MKDRNGPRHRTPAAVGRAGPAAVSAVLGVLAAGGPVGAGAQGPEAAGTAPVETALEWSGLTENERARAGLWGLSGTEWKRYRSVMEGIRGSVSPSTISPVEVLGIHARDAAERRRYAQRWAAMMRSDAERILAFQHAYDEANRALYAGQPVIDIERLPESVGYEEAVGETGRVLYFGTAGCAGCNAVLSRLLARLDRVGGIDIYLLDMTAGDEDAMRTWALLRGIRAEWVQARRVTLNFGAEAFERLAGAQRPEGERNLPVLFVRRGETVAAIEASLF